LLYDDVNQVFYNFKLQARMFVLVKKDMGKMIFWWNLWYHG